MDGHSSPPSVVSHHADGRTGRGEPPRNHLDKRITGDPARTGDRKQGDNTATWTEILGTKQSLSERGNRISKKRGPGRGRALT